MLDRHSRITPAAQVVESLARRQPKPADPCAMVIFDASDGLTKRLGDPGSLQLAGLM